MPLERVVLMVDAQSFYASIEKVAHPEYRNSPVGICDPERPSGILLTACPIAKAQGVSTASRLIEALRICPELVPIRPRMGYYIRISLMLTGIYETVTDRVEPFSNDEAFLDVTGCRDIEQLVQYIMNRVYIATGIAVRIGIGPTKVMAKMALDNFAKKHPTGTYRLDFENIERDLWPLPVHNMFMVASRMAYHFNRMGLATIGDIAKLELREFKQMMHLRMGRQSDIQAEYYWQMARGIDPSPVEPSIRGKLQSVSHGKTLPRGRYSRQADIEVVLLELVIEVCRRARRLGVQGWTVMVGAGEMDGERGSRFARQLTLERPTSLTHEVAGAVMQLFREHWQGMPVTHLYVSLNQLTGDSIQQLDLFEDRAGKLDLEKTVDRIKDKYGSAALMRASSLLEAGVARERAGQIGGHYA